MYFVLMPYHLNIFYFSIYAFIFEDPREGAANHGMSARAMWQGCSVFFVQLNGIDKHGEFSVSIRQTVFARSVCVSRGFPARFPAGLGGLPGSP